MILLAPLRTVPGLAVLALVAAWMPSARAATDADVLKKKLAAVMAQEVKAGFWGVAYVSRHDETLLHEGYGFSDRKSRTPMHRNTVIDSGSLSKQVTATAALELASEGRLSLEDPLSKHFPTAPADKARITLRQLLSHTGGLQEWVFPDDFTYIPREAWLEKVFAAPLVHKPGSGYLYSNDGVTLVAMTVEQVSGRPFKDYLRETFFRPLGMRQTGWYDDAVFKDAAVPVATGYRNGKDDGAPDEWPGPYWALLGNGGILWSVSDMLKWHRAVHGDLLPPAFRDELFRPIVADPERELYPGETGPMHYALAWRVGVSPCGGRRIGHTGTGLSHHVDYRFYPDQGLLIYVASNKLDRDFQGKETFFARRAAEALSGAALACGR